MIAIARRATAENAMFCAVSRDDAATMAALESCSVVQRPLQHLHAAQRAAQGRPQAFDTRASRARWTVTKSAMSSSGKLSP